MTTIWKARIFWLFPHPGEKSERSHFFTKVVNFTRASLTPPNSQILQINQSTNFIGRGSLKSSSALARGNGSETKALQTPRLEKSMTIYFLSTTIFVQSPIHPHLSQGFFWILQKNSRKVSQLSHPIFWLRSHFYSIAFLATETR